MNERIKKTEFLFPSQTPSANKSKQNLYPVNTLNTHSFQLEHKLRGDLCSYNVIAPLVPHEQ